MYCVGDQHSIFLLKCSGGHGSESTLSSLHCSTSRAAGVFISFPLHHMSTAGPTRLLLPRRFYCSLAISAGGFTATQPQIKTLHLGKKLELIWMSSRASFKAKPMPLCLRLSTVSLYFFSAQYLDCLMAMLVALLKSLHTLLVSNCLRWPAPAPTHYPWMVLSPHVARVPFNWSLYDHLHSALFNSLLQLCNRFDPTPEKSELGLLTQVKIGFFLHMWTQYVGKIWVRLGFNMG